MRINKFYQPNLKMLHFKHFLSLLLLLSISLTQLTAQAPANDICSGATEIFSLDGNAFTDTTVGSTNSDAPFNCADSGNLSEAGGVWYFIDNANTTEFDINVFLCGSEADTRLAVFSGSCNGLIPINGGDSSDKCGDDPSLIVTIVPNTTYYLYVTTAGFGSEGNYTVNINSANPPLAVCQDYSAGIDAAGAATVTADNINNQSQADFGIQSLEITSGTTTFDCTDIGNTFPLTLTVTDNNGDTGECTSTVTVVDAVPPSAVTTNATVTIPASGTVTVTSADVVTSTSDNCPGVDPVITIEPNTFTINEFGENPVIVTVSDPDGPSSSYPVTVTVDGDADPVAVCQDFTVELDETGAGTCTTANIDGGSYAPLGQMFLGISAGQTDFTCADVGSSYPVTLMITDVNGTSDDCTATVTVEDNLAPTVSGGSVYFQVADGQTLSLTAEQTAFITDNCGTPVSTVTPNEFTPANNGQNTVIISSTDPNGNTATGISTVFINEPNPNGPNAYCLAERNYAISMDNETISGNLLFDFTQPSENIVSYTTSPTVGCADIGSVVPVTLTVTDNNGATATCVSNVTVNASGFAFDFSNYNLNTSNIFIPVGQTVSTASLFSGSVTGICSSVNLTYSPSTISWEDAGSDFYNISVTADDGNGGIGFNSYNYNLDTDGPIARCISPSIEVPTTILPNTINNGSSGAAGLQSIVLQDGNVSFACGDANLSQSVTLVVTDNNGVSTSCSTTVFASDPPPVVNANDITINVNAGETVTITGGDVGYFASDNCESLTGPDISKTEYTSNDAGINSVSVCATTNTTGQVGCEFIIVTVNTTAPVARCTDAYVSLDEFGGASISASDIDAGSSASAGIAFLSVSGNTFYGCSSVGVSQPVTLTVQDNNGATASCDATVFVSNNTPPVVTIQDISIGIAPGGSYTVQPSELYTDASSNCGIGTPEVSPNTFTMDNVGDNFVSLNIPYSNGSPNFYSPNVYVNRPPNGNCPSTTIVPVETTVSTADIGANATADNGIASLTISPDNVMFTCSDIGAGVSEQITLTVTDNLGHVSTCETTAVPADITPPVIVANDITIVINQGESRNITLEDLGATFTDECSGMNSNPIYAPNFSPSTFFDFNAGANTTTINAYDEAFNYASTSVTVTVEVNVLPAAVCQDYTVSLDASGNGSVVVANIDGGSATPAGFASNAITIDQTTFTCDDHGATFPATLTVTDVNGDSDQCTATVTVADNLPPVVVAQDITISVAAGATTTVSTAQVHVSSTDNCAVASMTLSPNSFTFDNAGSTYPAILDVVDVNGNHSNTPVNITVADAPTNVACGSAIELPSGQFTGSTINVTNSDPAPAACGDSDDLTVAPGVWYFYVGDGNTCTLDLCGSPGNTRVGVYTGSCGAYNCVAGGDSNTTGSCTETDDPLVVFPTTVGTTYYIYFTHGDPGEENTFTVNPVSVAPPVASCFPNYPVYLDDAGNGTISAEQINCASQVPAGLAPAPEGLAITDGPTTFDCSNAGETPTVTLTVTDNLGQTSTCTSTVNVIDNTEPTVVVTENPTIIAEDGETVTLDPADFIISASDNCDGDITYSINPPTLTPPSEGEYPVVITVTPPTGDPIEIPVTITVTNQPDLCGQAATISCGQTLTGTTVGATNTDEPDFCGNMSTGGAGAPGVWYTFNGTGDYVTMSLCNSDYDTQIGVYTGSCDALSCVTGNDDNDNCTSNDLNSEISFPSEPNVTYYIYVTGYNSTVTTPGEGPAGNYTLSCMCTPPPVASCNPYTVEIGADGTGSLTVTDIDNGSSAVAGIASLAITAGATDYTCVDVTPNALPIDYVAPTVSLTVTDNNGLSASCDANISVVDNIAPIVTVENITIVVTTGQTVTVEPSEVITSVIDNCESEITYTLTPPTFFPEDEGDNPVVLTVSPPGSPPFDIPVIITVINIPVNNECSGAESIACGQSITGTTEGATTIGAPAACFNSGNLDGAPGVWYTFAGTGENVEMSLEGSPLDTRMAVYRGDCDGLTCVTGEDDVVGDDARVFFGTETGVTYYIYVTGTAGDFGTYTLTCGCFPAAPNDACANAELMSAEGLYNGTNVGANATNPPPACGLSGDLSTSPGVWYTYEGDNTMVTLALCGSTGDTKMAVYEGDCDNLTCVNGEDDDFSECGDNDPSITWNADIGKTYYIYITNFGTNNSDPFVIDLISITPPDAICVPFVCNLDANGNGTVTVENVDGGSTAEAGIQSIAITSGSLSYGCSDVGVPASVTLTVTDNNGTTGTCNSTITVVDPIAPIVVPQDITINVLPEESVMVQASQCIFSMSDNCEIAFTELSMMVFTQDNEGDNPVMITVTDINGNPTMVPANVFVINRYPLDVICRQPISTCNDPGQCGKGDITILPPHIPLGMELESLTNDAPDYFPVGTTDIVWTVVSTFGLVSECVSQVIIYDEEAPVLNCPANIVRYTAPSQCAASIFLNMEATDNCGLASFTGNGNVTLPIGLHEQEFVATDMAGNSTTCITTIAVHDTTAPVVVSVPDDFTVNAPAGASEIQVSLPEPVITDACGAHVMLLVSDILPVGETTEISWKGMDNYGNWLMVSYNVTVLAAQDIVSNSINSSNTISNTNESNNFNNTPAITSNETASYEEEVETEEEELFILETSVYPNPARERATLDIGELPKGYLTITLLDNMGRTLEERFYQGYGHERLEFDLSQYSKGLLMFRLTQDGELIDIQRIVKQ